jgi:hypothetical protein
MEIRMKNLIYLLFLLKTITFQSCSGDNTMNNLEDTINYVTRKTGEEIEKVIPNLELSGIGGSMKDNVVNHEKLVFKHKGKMNEDEGALLLVKVVGSESKS